MTATLAATIKGRTFRLAAPDGEARSLADAIAVVEAQCSLIVQKQPGAEIERVLLLAALELAAQRPTGALDPAVETRLAAMAASVKGVLDETSPR
ncbi:MAG: cell division protein ZapA [Burkholderiales bacterium]|nr:cell division protein ZapA [Pseudomonadota bacterium]MCC7067552.1 cell division protein ZapA [Burkholderiales bacterium]MCZ2136408.1 cell division protein ZapA [Burkholderiales bacterium]